MNEVFEELKTEKTKEAVTSVTFHSYNH